MPLPARRPLPTLALAPIPRAVALNFAVGAVVGALELQVYFDSVGTYGTLRDRVHRSHRDAGVAVIPHNLKFAQATCDHNVTIDGGHVSHIGRISLETDYSSH